MTSRKNRIVYQRHHIKVKECRNANGTTYYTVFNTHGTHGYHSHFDSLGMAIMCANHAYNMHIPAEYSEYLKHSIRRVIFGEGISELKKTSAQ